MTRRDAVTRALLPALLLVACSVQSSWKPRTPDDDHYDAIRMSARRVTSRRNLDETCREIGTVEADGARARVIDALSHEAARHGGTDYVIQSSDEGDRQTPTVGSTIPADNRARDRGAWAIAYRCE